MKGRAGFFIFLIFFPFIVSSAQAATLDQLYGPIIGKGEFLFAQDVSFFNLEEESQHGLALYGEVESDPQRLTFDSSLRFSPLEDFELTLGLAQDYPLSYKRKTHSQSGSLAVLQDYRLSYLEDFYLQGRLRNGPLEPYLSVLEKRQKAGWHSTGYPAATTDYFTYILSHYEDITAGMRYLSAGSSSRPISDLSYFNAPLLDAGQLNLDMQLRYRNGSLRRNSYYYFNNLLSVDYNMYHRLAHQFMGRLDAGYGLGEKIGLESGFGFSFPYRYFYEYRSRSSSGLTILKSSYKFDRDYYFPIGLRLRPADNFELYFFSENSYSRQRLDYSRKETNGSVTGFNSRKLEYFNFRPSLTLSYLLENGKHVVQDRFSELTKAFLSGGQQLIKLVYLRDVTILDKSNGNGPQNRIDPYNVFLYPLDYFMIGTEYATFFAGNNSGSAADIIAAQDYHLVRLDWNYGISDRFNLGATVGYRSKSSFHNFTVGGSSTYELKTRRYTLAPSWFFGIPCSYRVAKNALVSLSWTYTPGYRTALMIDGLPEEFTSKTNYHTISFSARILF